MPDPDPFKFDWIRIRLGENLMLIHWVRLLVVTSEIKKITLIIPVLYLLSKGEEIFRLHKFMLNFEIT